MKQIIKQPNGKFALWSSIIDNFTHYDLDRDEIVETLLEEYRERIEKMVDEKLEVIVKGGRPYSQFTITYPEAVSKILDLHGKEEFEEVIKLMGNPE